jgi:hypothetical protein
LDDFELGAVEKNSAGELMHAIPPQAKVDSGYQKQFDEVVGQKRSGLVIVVGSTLRNRRIVVEQIVAASLKRGQVALLNFPPIHEKHLPAFDCKGDTSALWDKARDAEPHALGISTEDAQWAIEAIHFLTDVNCFIVGSMKSVNNRSAVVRHLAADGKSNLESLLAVAWIQDVTAEVITFGISQGGGWGDGTWEAVLERDELLKRMPRSS